MKPKRPPNLKLFKSLSLARTAAAPAKDAPSANLVLAALRSFCITGQRTCNPSINRIAEMLGISEKTVDRALKTLVATGRIAVEVTVDALPSVVDGREVYLHHNVYVILCDPQAYEKFGLFPVELFGNARFTALSITAQSVLLALHLLAQGFETVFFLMPDLMLEALIKKREFALKALDELQDAGLLTYTNPCGRSKPYESTHMKVTLSSDSV